MAGDVYISFGGDTAGLEAAISVAKAEVKSLQAEMNALGREMQSTGATADSALGQSLRAAAENLVNAKAHTKELGHELSDLNNKGGSGGFFSKFKEGIEGSLESLIGFKAGLAEIAELVVVAFAVEKIAEFTERMVVLGRETTKASEVLGIPSTEVASLGLIAKSTGIDLNTLELSFTRLSRNIIEEADGAKRALTALGLTFKDLKGKDAEEQLRIISNALVTVKDGSEKDAAGVALFGRSFDNLLPMLNEGSSKLDEWNKVAEETGIQLDGPTRAGMEATEKEMIRLGAAIQGAGIAVFKEFEPVINATIKVIADLAVGFTKSMKEGFLLKAAFDGIVIALQIFGSMLIATIKFFEGLWEIASTVIKNIAIAIVTLGTVAKDVFMALISGIGNFFSGLITAGTEATKVVGAEFVDLANVISSAFSGDLSAAKEAFGKMAADAAEGGTKIKNAFVSSVAGFDLSKVNADMKDGWAQVKSTTIKGAMDVKQVAMEAADEMKMLWGVGTEKAAAEVSKHTIHMASSHKATGKAAHDAAMSAIEGLNEEIRATQDAANQKQKVLNDALSNHRISMKEWLSDTTTVLTQEEAAVKALYEKELSNSKLTSIEKVRIKAQEADAIRKIQDQLADAERKSADDSLKSWHTALGTIESSFNSQLRGLLTGTTSWANAGKAILTDLVIKSIEGFEKMAFNWIANQLAMTSATVAGSAARTAAETGASAAGVAASIGNILKTIGAEAAQTFGGIFAFLSPVLGPAAVGPAAAGQATVLAAASAVSVYDTGSWNIPSDRLAAVHAGEVIIPSRGGLADEFREMASGGGLRGKGGGDTHLHVHAIDASSVVQMFKDNGREFAKILKKQVELNPSLRPAI